MARGHTNEARDAILTAAEKCFAEAGFAGASVNDILAGTRFTKPVLYYHFGSKEGLFRALLERAQAACFDVIRQRAADASDLEGQLTGIITALFELLRDRRDLTRLLIASAFAAPRELPEALRAEARRMRTFVFVRGLIAAARRRGELDSRHSAHALACNFYGALTFQIMSDVLAFPGTRLNRRAAARIVTLFLNGARSR
jgi:AcrR family transcriptional regulator